MFSFGSNQLKNMNRILMTDLREKLIEPTLQSALFCLIYLTW